jgi:hypothetical protein
MAAMVAGPAFANDCAMVIGTGLAQTTPSAKVSGREFQKGLTREAGG